MNANAVLVCLAVGFFALSFASPDLDDVTTGVKELVPLDIGEAISEMHVLRFRRATCDLLSFNLPWGSLNHSACAAHCLAMRKGYRGGRCKDGVCHCRK